jgi:hypothetical protein
MGAALTKATVSHFGDRVGAVLGDWHVFALVVVSVAAFWLERPRSRRARSRPPWTTMAFDPLSSLVFESVLFQETFHETALGYAVSALSLAVALAGLVILARAGGAEPRPLSRPAHVPARA